MTDKDKIENIEFRVKRLEETVFAKAFSPRKKSVTMANFTNIRAFLNFIHKKLKSGQERILAVAIFKSGGRPANIVNSKELVKLWNKNRKFLKEFDPQYFTRAVEKGWLTPMGGGTYKLEADGVNYFVEVQNRK